MYSMVSLRTHVAMLWKKTTRVSLSTKSQAPLFQIRHQLHIKFPHIKPGNVLPVQIDHISVGNPPFSRHCQELIAFSPEKRFFRYQTIVWTVKIFDQGVCKIQGEFTADGTVQLGTHALTKNTVSMGDSSMISLKA